MSREEQRMKRKKNSEDKLQFKGTKTAEGMRKGMRLFADEFRKNRKQYESKSSPGRYVDQPGERPMATERLPEKEPDKKTSTKKTPDLKSMTPEEREEVRLLMEAGISYDEYKNRGKGDQSISSWKGEGDLPKSNAEGKKLADAEIAREKSAVQQRTQSQSLNGASTRNRSNYTNRPNDQDGSQAGRPGGSYGAKKQTMEQDEYQSGRPGGSYGAKKQTKNAGTRSSQYAITDDGKDVAPSGVMKRSTDARRMASSRLASVNNSSRQAIKGPNVQNGLREVLTEAFSHGYGGGTGNNTGANQNRQTDNRNLSGSKRDYLRRKGY